MEIFRLREIRTLLSSGALTFDYLDEIRFSPYYPYGIDRIEFFNEFSRMGVEDVKRIFLLNEFIFKKNGVKALSITGSAGVGLANQFPYSCEKIRLSDGYVLKRIPRESSDIDVECLFEGTVDFIGLEKSLRQARALGLLTPPNSLNFAFYPLNEIQKSITSDPFSSALVRFGVWSIARVVFFGDEVLFSLREKARSRVNRDPDLGRFFWQNLSDRYFFHQCRIEVKNGNVSEIFLPSIEVPTLFDLRVRLSKFTDRKVFFVI